MSIVQRRIMHLAVAASLALYGCGPAASSRSSLAFKVEPTLRGNRIIGEVDTGGGVSCYVDGAVGRASYLVSDLGKSGVPALDDASLREVRAASKLTRSSPTLRFALVGHQFIIFDATDGPCSGGAYRVIGRCEMYSPTDDLGSTTAPSRSGCGGRRSR